MRHLYPDLNNQYKLVLTLFTIRHFDVSDAQRLRSLFKATTEAPLFLASKHRFSQVSLQRAMSAFKTEDYYTP